MLKAEWKKRQLLGREWIDPLYDEEKWQYGNEIPVSKFREILLWPLFVAADGEAKEAGTIPSLMRDIADSLRKRSQKPASDFPTSHPELKGAWEWVEDPLQHICKQVTQSLDTYQNAQYSEFVYFHDVIQDFLYQKQDVKKDRLAVAPLHLFRRTDLTSITIELDQYAGECTINLAVDRCNLYLASSGIILLAMEVNWTKGQSYPDTLTFADVQRTLNQFRRTYSPYLEGCEGNATPPFKPGQSPKAVHLHFCENGVPREEIFNLSEETLAERNRCLTPEPGHKRVPQIFSHWADLLWPFCLCDKELANYKMPYQLNKTDTGKAFALTHIVDERIPLMSYISLSPEFGRNCNGPAQLSKLSRGDWIRLCFADDRGTDPLPYNPHFLKDFEDRHCYDRFFTSPSTPDASSRMTFSSYAFSVAGAGWFFDNVMQEHFRRHYFQTSLLAYLEHASLLGYSKRLTNIVAIYEKAEGDKTNSCDAEQEFHHQVGELKREFLQYTHQFRFSGVSNQMQPTEMYNQWRDVIGLHRLYDDVKVELDSASDFLIARDQKQQTDAAANIGVVASVGVVFGIVFGFLGMNVLFATNPLNIFWRSTSSPEQEFLPQALWLDLAIFTGVLGVVSLGVLLVLTILKKRHFLETRHTRFTERFLRWGSSVCLLATSAICLYLLYFCAEEVVKPSSLNNANCFKVPAISCQSQSSTTSANKAETQEVESSRTK